MNGPDAVSERASVIRASLVFVMHQIGATFGVGIVASALLFSSFGLLHWLSPGVLTLHNASRLLTEVPYFPIQVVVGLWSGWFLGRRLWERAMLWVWVLPLLALCCMMIVMPHLTLRSESILTQTEPLYRLSHYFGNGCNVKDGCFDQLMFTMPLYASVSYSIGALLGRMRRKGG
ncbi:MAG TPA: hypothetical protein VMH00_07870 [Candidatus Limnocylindrales bacterium]|nr:hypothetical protein [Candidatus Limnocylindrales bacterium]